MKNWYYLSLALLMITSFSCEKANNDGFDYSWQVMQIGDSLEWASPTYDDTAWMKYYPEDPVDTIYWVRLKVRIPAMDKAPTGYGLKVGGTGSYEAYWDGHYLSLIHI